MGPRTEVKVKLINESGNGFAILAKTRRALREAGYHELAEQYLKEAQAGDYDNLLRVTMEYVVVE